MFRVQVAHCLRFLDGLGGIDVWNFRFIYCRAAQETRLVVIVVGDHFQNQRAHFIAMTHQGEQQAVGVIELRPIKLAVGEAGKFLDLRRAEIVARDGINDLAVACLDAGGIKADVFENFHGETMGGMMLSTKPMTGFCLHVLWICATFRVI